MSVPTTAKDLAAVVSQFNQFYKTAYSGQAIWLCYALFFGVYVLLSGERQV